MSEKGKMMTVREAALRLLLEYEESGKYVNLSLSSHIADNFSSDERSFLTVLLYTTVERKLTYDYYIAALSGRSIDSVIAHTKNLLRLGLSQILHINSVPDHAAVNETVKLAKNAGERSFVNGILRAAVRKKDAGELPLPDKEKNYQRYLSVRESFPLSIVKLFTREYGIETAEKLLLAFNSKPHTDISVNTLKISRDGYLEMLLEHSYEALASKNSSISIRIPRSVSPTSLPGFSEGLFFVQDESCAICAEVLGVLEGQSIADVCAAPGGKSFAAAILSNNKANIYSFDLHESKLSLIKNGAERLALSSVEASVRDATTPCEELVGRLDRVICDVPCSGLGVLGKKPDLRYNAIDRTEELPGLQYEILTASSRYLKVGGRLVYSTCTLSPSENRDVVCRFISGNPGYRLCPFSVGELSSDGMLTLMPHIHGTDGFFIALIEKTGK